MGGQDSMAALSFFHYGDLAAETADRERPVWQAWIQGRFPIPAEQRVSD